MNETNQLPSEKTGKTRFNEIVKILATCFERMKGEWDIEEEPTDENPPEPEDVADSPNAKKTL